MANLKGCFSHKSDDWSTPLDIYRWFMSHCYYDPCPLNADFDGLAVDWKECVFCNPPYSDILSFVEKAIRELDAHHCYYVVFLLPVRTDTKWFKLLCDFGCEIDFIRGRLKFGGSKAGAPFPFMFVRLWQSRNDATDTFCVIDSDLYSELD